jgi:hypothetical protein
MQSCRSVASIEPPQPDPSDADSGVEQVLHVLVVGWRGLVHRLNDLAVDSSRATQAGATP